ncbi:Uncharacterized protein TCAP_05720, partial [Tolypocladium capitatum]
PPARHPPTTRPPSPPGYASLFSSSASSHHNTIIPSQHKLGHFQAPPLRLPFALQSHSLRVVVSGARRLRRPHPSALPSVWPSVPPPRSLDNPAWCNCIHIPPASTKMRASAALVVFAAAVSAQQNYTSDLDMKIDPNSVPVQTRATWCQAQTNTCGLLCGLNTNKNSCSLDDLSYQCTCTSNNSMPGLQYYTQTMPSFICETLFSQCNTQQVGNADGQKACTDQIQKLCGHSNPPKAPVSGGDDGDGSSTASGTVKPSSSNTGSGSSATSKTSGSLAAPTMVPGGNGAAVAAAVGFLAYLI